MKIGFIGSGFNARFHIQSLTAVREIDVRGVYSPNEKNAASSAALAREFERGIVVAAQTQEARSRHRYAPEAPCVTFGSSLEPFSAICSCELPVEVSSATSLFDSSSAH